MTGGVTAKDLPFFQGVPVGVVISGRGIVKADDPLAAATDLRETIGRVWPQ